MHFSTLFLALDHGATPRIFNIKESLEAFITFRREVVVRRSLFDLEKSKQKAHILEGLRKALDSIDKVISLIRASSNTEEAKRSLMSNFDFSEAQTKSILEMRLQKLTSLEQNKLDQELKEITELIAYLEKVVSNYQEVSKIIHEELTYIKSTYATPRRTEILSQGEDTFNVDDESLINDDPVIITISKEGEIKKILEDEYRLQKRGGVGLKGSDTRVSEDYIWKLINTTNKTELLCFSNLGRVYSLKPYKLPLKTRTSKGSHIKNVLNLQPDENIYSILPNKSADKDVNFLVCFTRNGLIKKTSMSQYTSSRMKNSGLNAFGLKDGDELVATDIGSDNSTVVMINSSGRAIVFETQKIRAIGRTAAGVRGMKVSEGVRVISGVLVEKDDERCLVLITKNGMGKRVSLDNFSVKGRGGQGMIAQKLQGEDEVVGMSLVDENDELVITTNTGQSIRMKGSDLRIIARNSQGVRVIKLKSGEQVVDFTVVDEEQSPEKESEVN